MERGTHIAVIGAGIGGLTAAIALKRAGFGVTVYEQSDRLGDVGAGITITPNAWKGLASLGLTAGMEAAANIAPRQAIRHHQTGVELSHIMRGQTTLDTYGAPYAMFHRADLHAILAAAVGPDAIRLNAPIADAREVEADAVIAADGLKSATRSLVFHNPEPRFTGHVAWRGLVPADRLSPEASQPGSLVWAGPGRIFVRYAVRNGALVNLVGLTRTEAWRGEGWSQRAEKGDLLTEFAGWHADVIDAIEAIPEDQCMAWGLFARTPLDRIVEGKVALLGDAAHPMLPFLGQGAAMAIEDGVIMGRAFAASSSVEEALNRYAAARIPRTSFIQLESHAGADRLQFEVARTAQGPARNEDTMGIFHYDPATEPV